MGVDTHGLLKGKVEPEKVLNFIIQKFDKNAIMDKINISDMGLKKDMDWIKESYGENNLATSCSTIIGFKYNDEDRSLFYCYSNYNSYENLKFYSDYGLEDMVKAETTYLSLGCWGSSVDIMKSIVTEFGGWIDENDCDDKEYYPILKDSNGEIKPVIYVTMEDIYEKFGGVVIIKKEA